MFQNVLGNFSQIFGVFGIFLVAQIVILDFLEISLVMKLNILKISKLFPNSCCVAPNADGSNLVSEPKPAAL
jgi:hypothetical protein